MTTRIFSPNFALYLIFFFALMVRRRVNYDRESVLSFVLPAWFDLALLLFFFFFFVYFFFFLHFILSYAYGRV